MPPGARTKPAKVGRRIQTLWGLLFLLWPSLSAAQKEAAPDLSPFLDAIPACDASLVSCVGIHLHIVVKEEDKAVQIPEWFAAQVEGANRLFALIGVAFTLREVSALPAEVALVETRGDRDLLGRRRYSRGDIHVFLVEKLANVDEEGFLNGVHWRDRAKKARRWVILSSTAWELTLAHELGHFFGLPHSAYDISLMNKSPREEPPPEERSFSPEEIEIMKKSYRKMTRSKELR